MYRREITPAGERTLRKLEKEVRAALVETSRTLDQDPFGNGERLHGPLKFLYSFHFKCNNVSYRAAYTIDVAKSIILIHYVGPRESFYDRLRRQLGV